MDNDNMPNLPPELLAEMGDSLVNLYATVTPKGFSVRTIDTNKVVVSHDGRVMEFFDPQGVQIYTIDNETEQNVVDGDVDLLMNIAWGEGFADDLHVVLEGFMSAMGPLLDALEDMEDGE